MIQALRANKRSFKPVEFSAGFNVILADRTKDSTKKDSRNGLGKSTLIELLHFCLGSRVTKGKGLLAAALAGWQFSLDLDLAGQTCTVTRGTDSPGVVSIEGNTSAWAVQPRRDRASGAWTMSIADWNLVLGQLMFGLDALSNEHKYKPSFRSLISYFVRRGWDAFSDPFHHHRRQSEWDVQVSNAFLIGLTWEDASDWQILKDKKKLIESLRRAAKGGVLADMFGSLGTLEAQRVRLQARVQEEVETLRNFRVHAQYREIEEEANELTKSIHGLANDNVLATQMLSLYSSSVEAEQEPRPEALEKVYAAAGVELPGVALRRLEDVKEFHSRLIENRRGFLLAELDHLQREISARRDSIREKTEARAALLEILQSHNALDEYTRLQRRQLDHVAELEQVTRKIDDLRQVQQGHSALLIDQEQLHQRAQRDYDERYEQRERAIRLFNENSQSLYSVPGNLVIDVSPSGFKFNVSIERSGSQGISSMKIFCYDLMLAEIWATKDKAPGFLVHDSTLYDSVDERQVGLALELAMAKTNGQHFQYICALNSDKIPSTQFSPGFSLEPFVRVRLTDSVEGGDLLGVRF